MFAQKMTVAGSSLALLKGSDSGVREERAYSNPSL